MCFFCKESSVTGEESKGLIFYDCPNCGKYAFEEESHEFITSNRDKLASFLFYNQSENVKRIFIGEDNLREKYENDFRFVSEQEIKNFYPETFSEKINMILKYVASKSRFFGDLVKIKQQFLYTFFFIRTCIDGSNLQKKDIERQIYPVAFGEFQFVQIDEIDSDGFRKGDQCIQLVLVIRECWHFYSDVDREITYDLCERCVIHVTP